MIVIANQEFTLATPNTDASRIYWTLSSDNECVTMSQTSGVIFGTSGSIYVTFSFANEDCFESTTFTLTGEDDKGCVATPNEFTISNVCLPFQLSVSPQPAINGHFQFMAAATGLGGNYSYEWLFDTTFFELVSNSGNILLIKIKDGVILPDTTNIICTATAANGCKDTVTFIKNICKPFIIPRAFVFSCYGGDPVTIAGCGNATHFATVTFGETLCTYDGGTSFVPIDWSTLQVTFDEPSVCYKQRTVSGVPVGVIDVYILYPPSHPDEVNMNYSVADTNGVRSDVASTVSAEVLDCMAFSTPRMASTAFHVMNQDEIDGEPVLFDITKMAQDPDLVDWDTFTFVAGDNQVLVDAFELTGVNGTAILLPSRKVEYTSAGESCNVEIIQFTTDTLTGLPMNVTKIYIDFEPYIAPVTSTDTSCAVAGTPQTIDILDNDSGRIEVQSVVIVTPPTLGTVAVNSNGTIVYTGSTLSEGSDSLEYTVASPDGAVSDATEVEITLINAGINRIMAHCDEDVTLDAELAISNNGTVSVTAGGTWAESGDNPTAIGVGTPNALDFAGADHGVYTFTYTVTCGGLEDVSTLTVNFLTSGMFEVNFLNSLLVLPALSDPNTFICNYDIAGFTDSGGVTVKIYREATPSGTVIDPANFVEIVEPSTFNALEGTMVVTYETAELGFDYQVRVEYYDSCGELRFLDSDVITVS
jgi:hypothetical protein